jgi:cyclic pyranopterin phosphate synthase
MPLDEYVWTEKSALLSFEEITRLASIFIQFGVEQIRLTGGEPLVRQNLPELIARLTALDGLRDLSLTTNGSLLATRAAELRRAGLNRINVSLDTLRPDRFIKLTKRGNLAEVLNGIQTAREVGFESIKINAVVIEGVNEDEIIDLVGYSRTEGLEIRFIEYMDVGNANDWSLKRTVPKRDILQTIHSRYPLKEVGRREGRAPATDYEFVDGTGSVGIIGSVTEPFCSSCTRGRLTADGRLVTCLFSETGFDLKTLLRGGERDEAIASVIRSVWGKRQDRYSDERWQALKSGSYIGSRKKIEMITLGG